MTIARMDSGSDAPHGIDFGSVDVLTFDCYGTLIDWEAGILGTLRPFLPHGRAPDDAVLEAFAAHETVLEATAWRKYREVLEVAMTEVCADFGVTPSASEVAEFGSSVARWPAFADARDALRRLADRFDLGVITNCDDDLFAASNQLLGEPFRWIVTAEQVRAYKPSRRNFEVALERIDRPRARIVHVAQSLFHDHVPAKAIGLRTVWVNRRAGRPGPGATPVAEARPDVVMPDMATLADVAAEP